jgi:hypothetical protein
MPLSPTRDRTRETGKPARGSEYRAIVTNASRSQVHIRSGVRPIKQFLPTQRDESLIRALRSTEA